jgi:hypothetical protein
MRDGPTPALVMAQGENRVRVELAHVKGLVVAKWNQPIVIFMADARKNYYVQFAAERGKTILRAEAVSNEYLASKLRLSQEQIKQPQLVEWSVQGVTGDYYRTWNALSEEDRLRIAGEVIRTLEVYGWEPSQPLDVDLVLE